MDKSYFLMLKTHKITGLKYLCFHYGTEESCFTYKGSGKYWLQHLSKHGKDIDTVILEKSADINYIKDRGIEYSKLWDVVKSNEYANLTIEDAQSTAEPLQRKSSRIARNISILNRIKQFGLTPKEIDAKKKAIEIMHKPEIRERAYEANRERFRIGNLTEKQRLRGENFKKRRHEFGASEKEKKNWVKISERQMGKTMRDRLKDPNWVNPNKGKTAKEIHGDEYVHPLKGKTLEEIKGRDYISPKTNPFKLIVNGKSVEYYKSEKDFITKTRLSSLMLLKIKKTGSHTIKRQSNSLHKYTNGDYLEYFPISIDDYKTHCDNC